MTNASDTPSEPQYGPASAALAPRYSGVRTFARCPHVSDLAGADVAVVGVPFDTGTSYRPGPRFGPDGIRAGSQLLRPYHPPLDIDVFGTLSVVDAGDLAVTSGNAARTLEQIAQGVEAILRAGVVPLVLGGDHTIVLGELRGHAAVHGPMGLILLDAHADTWDAYFGEPYAHGTPLWHAVKEGVLDPHRSLLAGMRGSLYGPHNLGDARAMGFEVLTTEELRATAPADFARLVAERLGGGPAFLSFDIDVLDPAFAPATGTPEVCGLLPHEAIAFVRSLVDVPFTGFDVVEVSPPYDNASQTTAMLAANVAYELLAIEAKRRAS
ncbi:MAG TPA: agmatinase [Conexibacter sp.]|jgi:agmatinase|nr:agmatinase [Conexibacter sp.]